MGSSQIFFVVFTKKYYTDATFTLFAAKDMTNEQRVKTFWFAKLVLFSG